MTGVIEGFTTRVVQVPLREPIPHPFMGARTQFATLLLEVRSNDGCTGFGFATMESLRLVRAVQEIVLAMEPALKGLDPARRAFAFDRMWNLRVDLLHDGAGNIALSAIDTALWDLCGKRSGTPLWQMLGGYRDTVPVYASGTLWRHHDNDRLQRDAADLVRRGYRAMKLRLGGGRSLKDDALRAKLVREAVGPEVALMVDALWGLSPMHGVRMARMLGELDYAWLEEPVREGDFAGLAQVRAERALPIAAGERISRVQHLEQLIPCVDHAILDMVHLGGITPWQRAAAALETANLPISSHSYSVVNTHLIASLRTGAWVEHMDWWDELFVDPPQVVDGAVRMSRAPGLGLTLDEAAVRRLAV
jgi:L-alanine-DL-glutamate epimerase-like enolase superfamily enzyme